MNPSYSETLQLFKSHLRKTFSVPGRQQEHLLKWLLLASSGALSINPGANTQGALHILAYSALAWPKVSAQSFVKLAPYMVPYTLPPNPSSVLHLLIIQRHFSGVGKAGSFKFSLEVLLKIIWGDFQLCTTYIPSETIISTYLLANDVLEPAPVSSWDQTQ